LSNFFLILSLSIHHLSSTNWSTAPESLITVAMLQHLVEESPEEADTRAVAAAAAHYITSVRCGADDELTFFTSQMLASVADKHSHITTARVSASSGDSSTKCCNIATVISRKN
jgi:16S rRNA U1498 N3-methylase RsmE